VQAEQATISRDPWTAGLARFNPTIGPLREAFVMLFEPSAGRPSVARYGVIELLVFDGDDTLWETIGLYNAAKAEFAGLLATLGFEPARSLAMLAKIDIDNVARLGFARERFPLSLTQAYAALCADDERDPDSKIRARIFAIGTGVFEQPAHPANGAKDLLRALQRRYALALCTKGDRSVQRKRIEYAGIGEMLDRIFIVDHKTASDFALILSAFGKHPKQACSIGNSLRSDINPALAAGLSAIWIKNSTWAYEDEGTPIDGPLQTVASLDEVPAALVALEETIRGIKT
jgi:putative hydrolase of the HAD superfamily